MLMMIFLTVGEDPSTKLTPSSLSSWITTSDTLVMMITMMRLNINNQLLVQYLWHCEKMRIIIILLLSLWVYHVVSLPHQPLLPSRWVKEKVLVYRTNLIHGKVLEIAGNN